MGLRIERHPVIHKPRKRIDSVTVPGRSGELTLWDGSYEDVYIRYECWFKKQDSDDSIAQKAYAISRWLFSAPVGARLEDTYDAQVFRKATFQGPLDIQNLLNRYGRFVLEFKCQPQAYLKSADQGIPVYDGKNLDNPTSHSSKPLIRIVGSIGGRLDIGDSGLTIILSGNDPHEIWIDCEELEAWEIIDGAEVPANYFISGYDFLTVQPGSNMVRFPGVWQSVTIWPRYYML